MNTPNTTTTPLTPERIAYLRRRAFLADLSGHNPSIPFVMALDKFLRDETRDLLEINEALRARLESVNASA